MGLFKAAAGRDVGYKLSELGTETFRVDKLTNTTNATVQTEKSRLEVNGTAANGIGSYKSFYIENAAGEIEEVARLEVGMSDVTDSSEDSFFKFYTKNAGTLANRLTIDTGGSLSGVGDMTFGADQDVVFIDGSTVAWELKDASGDTYLTFDSANSRISVGQNVLIANTKDIVPATAGGSDLGSTTAPFGDIFLLDSKKVQFGTSQDITMAWDGTDFDILALTSNSSIKLGVDDAGIDLVLYGDTTTVSCTWDQSADSLILNDNAKIVFGTGSDVTIRWDATDLDILAAADDSVIKIGNGTNNFDLHLMGQTNDIVFDASADKLTIQDSTTLAFGSSDDVTIAWDATDLDILAAADDSVIKIGNGTNSFDVWLYGNTATEYVLWDASADDLIFTDNVSIKLGTGSDVEIRWDATDLDILAAADDSVIKIGNGTNSFDVWLYGNTANEYVLWDASADDLIFMDNVSIKLGTGSDVEIRWDATDLDILAAADDSVIKIGNGTNSFDVWLYGNTASDYVLWDASANTLSLQGSAKFMNTVTAKTADYPVTTADFGKILTTRGASGAVIFTLPAASGNSGAVVEFYNVADQNMTVTGTDEQLVVFNDLTADSIGYTTAGERIGGGFRAVCDGTSWIVVPLGTETQTITIVSA